jgi:hypothetical protein
MAAPFPQIGDELAEFERTGYIRRVTDLARIPEKHGVTNVYADTGTCFANSAVSSPRLCAAMMGTLIKGLGQDHVFWGTDSVWYGSPQSQIEAFRRMEIPEDLRRKFGFAPREPAEGPVKSAILGRNSARLYKLDPDTSIEPWRRDHIGSMKKAYLENGPTRNNMAYGYVKSTMPTHRAKPRRTSGNRLLRRFLSWFAAFGSSERLHRSSWNDQSAYPAGAPERGDDGKFGHGFVVLGHWPHDPRSTTALGMGS